MQHKTSRRKLLTQLGLGPVALGLSSYLSSFTSKNMPNETNPLKGNINHSVCYWTCNYIPLSELCQVVKQTGFSAIDLVGPKDWPVLKENGVHSSMCNGAEINLVDGWNRKEFHATLIKSYTDHIDYVAKAGYQNLICFSGNRRGMDDETGMKNCTDGLKQVIGLAEKKGVILQMELLNSKINHKDYMCDRTAWGVELAKQIGSPNFKLLYDIYHMQIDEGDVIRTIRDNQSWIGHYHTGGVPGRHIIDESQELYYPAIIKAIQATGYKGYIAQEFVSDKTEKANKIAELKKAVMICDV
jgi:hydroxypyruvate isomerase